MPLLLVVGTINRYDPPGPGWQVIHVDASDRGIWDALQGRNAPIDVQADMRHLPYPDGSVDRIQSWHALEHVNQQGGRDTIAEFARVLIPGGVLDLRVPDLGVLARDPDLERRLPLIYGEQGNMPDSHLNAHHWGYDRRMIETLLAEHGFRCQFNPQPEHDDELHVIAHKA